MSWKLALLLMVFVPCLTLSQTERSRWSLLVKGGISDYAYFTAGNHGGGSSILWGSGPSLGGGAEYAITQTLRLQGTIDYTSYRYVMVGGFVVEGPTNTVYDISLNARFAFGFFSIIAGPAFYHEHGDQIGGDGPTVDRNVPESNSSGIAFNFSLGFSVNVFSSIDLFLEGGLRARHYTASVAQLGTRIRL